jgi:hypothetical protein
LIKFTFCDY